MTVASAEAGPGWAVRAGWPVGGSVVVGSWLVRERDLEVDLDAPAADVDSLDDEPQQALAAFEVELVQRGGDPLAESGESVTQPVLGGQLGAAPVSVSFSCTSWRGGR